MKLTYRRCGDYYLPNIGIPAQGLCPWESREGPFGPFETHLL